MYTLRTLGATLVLGLAAAAPASADWATPVGQNVVADAPIAGGGYPVPAGSTRPDAGTCRAGLYNSNRSESWIAVKPGTESLVGTSKLFFENFSTFYDFHLGAYAIARMQFRGRGLLFSASTSLMAIPPVVMIVPLFVLYTQLSLISTYQGAIIIYAGLITPFSVYLLTSFFRTLPRELFEAARIDGASDLLILLKIVIPLSLPALLTLVVVNALYVWNDLLIAIIFLQDDAKRTLMAGISVFQGRYNDQIPLTMAGMVFASAPMIILYITFQKHYIQGLMAGSVK